MNRRVLPKYCLSIAKVVFTSLTKLVHINYPKWLGECSSLRTQRCKNNLVRRWNCKLSSFTRVTSCESYGSSLLLQADLIINITKGDNRCSLFGIHSNILGSSLLVFLCRALIASFLSRSTLTWLCLQTINFWAALFLFLGWASNPYHIPCIKHRKNCENCRHKFPGKSSLNVRSVHPVCPGYPVCPDDRDDHDEHDCNDKHNHDNYGGQFCTFTFWQQRAI